MEEPIFEYKGTGYHFKIYENGAPEGFPDGGYLINRIPIKIAETVARAFDQMASLFPAKNANSEKSGRSQGTPE